VKPSETFSDAIARARRLLLLHDGLVDVRKYRIRKDWAKSFCKLMQWPVSAKIERVDSVAAVVVLRAGAQLAPADFAKESLEDLLRAALTLGVSALDRYVHERVVKGIVAALSRPSLNRAQQKLPIPAALALKISRKVLAAGSSGKPIRPANELRNELQEALHRRTFQSWREVETAFELIGVTGLTSKVQAAYGAASTTAFQDRLDEIAKRRNQIVHEADLVRHQRGGRPRHHPITRGFVADALDFLDGFVAKLESVRA